MADEPIVLAGSINKDHYGDDFYSHLSILASVEFGRSSSGQSIMFKYDFSKYLSLQQAAFEEAPMIENEEPKEVDWSVIDTDTSAFEERLIKSLSSSNDEGRLKPLSSSNDEDRLKPLISFSTDCFEKWRTYRAMYPKSFSNPWEPTIGILRRGRLLYISDKQDELAELSKSISRSTDEASQGNVGIIVKGKSPRLGGFVIDNRYEIQKKILHFLSAFARGLNNPSSLKDIQDYLLGVGVEWPIDTIQVNGTTPLKKTGVIGSTMRGFFVIENEDDLIAAYCFHLTKTVSTRTILRQYQTRAREFGDLNLEDECGGPTLNEL